MSTVLTSLPRSRRPDPMVAPPLRWGVIGPGMIGNRFAVAAHGRTQSRVVAVGSRSRERAAAYARTHGVPNVHDNYEALVADPEVEAVYVATPHSEHLAQAKMALAAGKPVLVEKAFTRNVREAEELVALAGGAKLTLMEAMWTRFLPHLDIIAQLLAGGWLGEVWTLMADHGQFFPPDPTTRYFDPNLAAGALLDLGVYPISFVHAVLGTPGRAHAVGCKAFTGIEDQVSMVFDHFEKHPHAHACVNTVMVRTPSTASINGELARIELPYRFYAAQPVKFVTRDEQVVWGEMPAVGREHGLAYEIAHFAQLVADGRLESDLMPWAETISVLRTIDGLRKQVGVSFPGEIL